MVFTHAILGCSNSSRKLTKWKIGMSEIQHVQRDSERYAHVNPLSGQKED